MRAEFLSLCVVLLSISTSSAQREFGFDNRKSSGQPYLTPTETVQRMRVADGFTVALAAAEPAVVNPIAFTVDETGAIWVVECFEYPSRTPPGKKPRDRIKVLRDKDGDGVYESVSVFAEGKDFPARFDLASGIEVGNGGVYLGAPPYLWFLKDTNGDGKADEFRILLKGFGAQDTHETLNTFQWGPDGKLYGLHGVFTQSNVLPAGSEGPPIKMNAALWSLDPKTNRFRIFAEGTSNPWGCDWRNSDGQFILACCVIPHLYHMVEGGIYQRQAGQSYNPHVYGYLSEICDHTFHRESGWAHAGLISLDAPHIPEAYRNSVVFGSIHGCSIKQNILARNGSTFKATKGQDFLVSGDKNFRPINLKWGPNGEILCIDWHDQNPCHQAKPDSWDYERGRIYRIIPNGTKTATAQPLPNDLESLVHIAITDANPWRWRSALRLLHELPRTPMTADKHSSVAAAIRKNYLANDNPTALRALWALHALGESVEIGLTHTSAAVRRFAVQLPNPMPAAYFARLVEIAKQESAPEVLVALAGVAPQLHGKHDTAPLVRRLAEKPGIEKDPQLPQLVWLAFEKVLTAQHRTELDWLKAQAVNNPFLTDKLVPHTMRRLVASGRADDIDACLEFVQETTGAVRRKALEGLTLAFKDRRAEVPARWAGVRALIEKEGSADEVRMIRQLAISFRDTAAIQRALTIAPDGRKLLAERVEAVRALALLSPPEAYEVLKQLALTDQPIELRLEAVRGLTAYDRKETAGELLAVWAKLPSPVRTEAALLLSSRKDSARALLTALQEKRVARTDVTDSAITRIRGFRDQDLDARIEKAWGKLRETPADLQKVIDRTRAMLYEGPASFTRGKAVFTKNCAVCHQFEGAGQTVGPALDGAGRDIEYILANVLDPNRVIGAPYFVRLVVLNNGRIESGLLHAEDDQSITLKVENAVLKTIPRKDIEEIQVQEKSLMPEGFGYNITQQDFRDLVRYLMAHPFITEATLRGPYPVGTGDSGIGSEKATTLSAGVPGRLLLPATVETQAVRLEAELTAKQEMKTRLLLGSGAVLKVRLNGKQVWEGRPGKPAEPDQAGVEVTLSAGVNRVEIEATYRGKDEAIYVRFLDPDRKLTYPEPK